VSVEGRLSFFGVEVGVFGSLVLNGELGLALRDDEAVGRAKDGGAIADAIKMRAKI
jgi:hypothetical protein